MMKKTSGKLAANSRLHQVNHVQVPVRQQNDAGFYNHLQHIWNNVMLLQDIVFMENENEKFNYAYRFAEIELEKVCEENASLRERIKELLANH